MTAMLVSNSDSVLYVRKVASTDRVHAIPGIHEIFAAFRKNSRGGSKMMVASGRWADVQPAM